MFRALLLRSVRQKIILRYEMEAMSHCCADRKEEKKQEQEGKVCKLEALDKKRYE